MRQCRAFFLFALLAAGPAVAQQGSAFQQTGNGSLISNDLMFTESPRGAIITPLPAAFDKAYLLAGDAFKDLGLKVNYQQPGSGEVGVSRYIITRKLAGEPLHTFVDCGIGTDGPVADSYRIYLNARTVVRSVAADRVELETFVDAEAKDMSGPSTAPSHCGTTGALERRLHTLVARKLATEMKGAK